MSKFGKKLLKAVKEMVVVAKCDHDWKKEKRWGRFMKKTCRKCKGTLYEPLPDSRSKDVRK